MSRVLNVRNSSKVKAPFTWSSMSSMHAQIFVKESVFRWARQDRVRKKRKRRRDCSCGVRSAEMETRGGDSLAEAGVGVWYLHGSKDRSSRGDGGNCRKECPHLVSVDDPQSPSTLLGEPGPSRLSGSFFQFNFCLLSRSPSLLPRLSVGIRNKQTLTEKILLPAPVLA